jgi:hypothetical protein
MFQSSPISGFSTIIHLIIIIVASAILWFRNKLFTQLYQVPSARYQQILQTKGSRNVKFVASILIVMTMSVIMLSSFFLAIGTALKQGAREPQVEFFLAGIAKLENIETIDLSFLNDIVNSRIDIKPLYISGEKTVQNKRNTEIIQVFNGNDLNYNLSTLK